MGKNLEVGDSAGIYDKNWWRPFEMHFETFFKAITGLNFDKKKREVVEDLVPLDAVEVVAVQVKAAIEYRRLSRLWEKRWLLSIRTWFGTVSAAFEERIDFPIRTS